jgi:glycerol-3-phosphate O-acyltransferase/dihydroxyacetone phosphate acyltransferase
MSRSYRTAMATLRLLIRTFFKRVEVEGLDNVPADRGGLLVAWHPNGLIDPSLIMAQLPGRVVFGARHGLLATPILGSMMRALGTVPIYRASDVTGDDAARREANLTSLDALADKIIDGSLSALFPEGVSHDAPHLMKLKTGAARLYYRARQLAVAQGAAGPPPVIIPVGLHYDQKGVFRSKALVEFHPPLDVPPDLDVSPAVDESDEEFLARARRLTAEIQRALEDAVHPTETWELHQLMHRGRELVRAERCHRAGTHPGRALLAEQRLGFARIWTGYRALRDTCPEEVEAVLEAVREYDADLVALGLEDGELDTAPRFASLLLPLWIAGQVVMVYLLLPPLLILGYIVNLPTGLLCGWIARRLSGASKDEASLKIIVGSVLFPLTWTVVGVLTAAGSIRLGGIFQPLSGFPLLAGLAAAILSATGGMVALRYRRLTRETVRAIRVRRTTKRRAEEIERLRHVRSGLHDWLIGLSSGLDLPGEVAPDGRVVSR